VVGCPFGIVVTEQSELSLWFARKAYSDRVIGTFDDCMLIRDRRLAFKQRLFHHASIIL